MKLSANKLGTLTVAPVTGPDLRQVPRRIQITDGTLSLVAKGFGELEKAKLPAGVYQVRVESAGDPFEQMIYVRPGEEVKVSYPITQEEKLSSPAPVPGGEVMHEYVRQPLDAVVTAPSAVAGTARIIVMATQPSPGGPPINISGLRLLDARGQESGTLLNATHGLRNEWVMSSRDVPEGGWVLETDAPEFGADKVMRQPLWCLPGWCTLLFVGTDPGTRAVDLSKCSIYHWRTTQPFAPEQRQETRDLPETSSILESQCYTELALRSLIDGRSLLSVKHLDSSLLVQKSQNPMLGILGCHLLLEQTSKDEALIRKVLRNLNELVPGHPDVIALEIMARRAGVKGLASRSAALSWPPMLRSAFIALRDEDWRKPGTISLGSISDRIRTRVLSGGVWCRWLGDRDRLEFSGDQARRGAVTVRSTAKHLANMTSLFPSTRKLVSYAKQFPKEAIANLAPEDLRWTGLSRPQAVAALKLFQTGPQTIRRIVPTRVFSAWKGAKAKAKKATKRAPARGRKTGRGKAAARKKRAR